MVANQVRPQPGPQELFLSTPADIAGYGGQAGGGKSFALMLETTRHSGNAEFGAVYFRRTLKMVKDEGGPWDESSKLFPLLMAVPNKSEHYWRFPSGSTVSFAGLEHESDKYNWQSAQIALLIFDELTHFLESQFWYLISRNRSMCGVKTPYIRVACNPGLGWVKKLFAPWVDRKFPNPAKSGEIRWFIRQNDQIVWQAGPPPVRPKCSCLTEGCENCFPPEMSITFVKASVYDNKELLKKNPGYLTGLMNLDEIEKRRLLYGDWDARPAHRVISAFDETAHVCSYRETPLKWLRAVGSDFGSVNSAEVIVTEDPVTKRLRVIGENWPGHGRPFETVADDIVAKAGRVPDRGAGGNRTTEQGWRQAMRKEGIPMEEPDPKHTDPGLQYQCVNDAFACGDLEVMESCPKLIQMLNDFQHKLDDEGLPTDKFDDTKFHLLAALRYIITKLRPPLDTTVMPPSHIDRDELVVNDYQVFGF